MKKLLLFVGSFVAILLLVGATALTRTDLSRRVAKRAGCGYTIVEYGIGIDCDGDTVRLVRSKGFQMASNN